VKQTRHIISVSTNGPGLYEITDALVRFLRGSGVRDGLLTCFIRHTSASLVIQENADPDVQEDLQNFFAHLATSGPPFRHTAEGPDDMPSHSRAALGTWQGLYVFEHRAAAHRREVMLHVIGE
jgi:secondary thiamine-phosphate synthase enzyme